MSKAFDWAYWCLRRFGDATDAWTILGFAKGFLGGGVVTAIVTAVSGFTWAHALLAFLIGGGAFAVARAGWALSESRRSPVVEAKAKAPSRIKRDVKIAEAIAYLGSGEWGRSFLDVMGAKDVDGVSVYEKFNQAALDGDITIWGRKGYQGLYEPLPKDYWKEWQVAYMSLLGEQADVEKIVHNPSGWHHHDLMTSKMQIEALYRDE